MRVTRSVATLTAWVLASGALVLAVPPALAAGDTCDSITAPDTEAAQRPDRSRPAVDLRIEEAHELLRERGRGPGEGVVVAVLDNGIAAGSGLPLLPGTAGTPEPSDWHGTAMAGVVAGPPDDERVVGFAPAARLVDVRVYDSLTPDDGERGLAPDGVAAGLRHLVDNHARLRTDIVLVPMPVARTAAMTATVEALTRLDVIVVAASGDRPDDESDPLFDELDGGDADEDSSEPAAGEDVARQAWPAGYDDVVAVSTTVPDGVEASSIVLQSSAIDVAAPTDGGVGYGLNGEPCVAPSPSTAWAAAEVAGVLALLETAYPGETAEQLVARLESTATGTAVTPHNVLTGHGIIQPLEALRRPLRPDEDGAIATSKVRNRDNVPVPIPESRPDLLESTRENALWWGLLGGGALLVAMVLRPVLARRR